MIRSLDTATPGMVAQQHKMDVISNNIANVNTTGFKKGRAEFKDLIYQQLGYSSAKGSSNNNPTGQQVGLGVKVSAVNTIHEQGSLKHTGNKLDLAIAGSGFFQIKMGNGETAYTRDGNFKIDSNGNIVTSNGDFLEPAISIPSSANDISISQSGSVTVVNNDGTHSEVGKIQLADFINPAGLSKVGNNLAMESGNSGTPILANPTLNGMGGVEQGFLEGSNVTLVNEMTELISTQRAYEANSKLIQTSDEILQTINGLKR